MRTIIVWYRNDLRIHDHPALARAIQDADQVVPVFVFDKELMTGKRSGSNRTRFLLECLKDLRDSFQKLGGDLIVRNGSALRELQKLAQETGAEAVYYTSDYSPFALKRDATVEYELKKHNIGMRGFGGKLIVSNPHKIMTKSGSPHKMFTPFWKNWSQIERREIATLPDRLALPSVKPGHFPALSDVTTKEDLSRQVIVGGETEARTRLHTFLQHDIAGYEKNHNLPGADKTSRLSAYLHFGCLSVREIETLLPDNDGAHAWHRQLAWRDFYHYVLFHYPETAQHEFQEKYRQLTWLKNTEALEAWQYGQTGYPMVDAAMRQLRLEGWMHNRGRLIVGSFLTKDLDIDWREGEAYFMRMLIDGDMANNNGNWQWVASVGVDPAPMYRRLYNPVSQGKNYDPGGDYVRKYVPELRNVADKYLMEPSRMPAEDQERARCIIGTDYPVPIVEHKLARLAALEKYRSISS